MDNVDKKTLALNTDRNHVEPPTPWADSVLGHKFDCGLNLHKIRDKKFPKKRPIWPFHILDKRKTAPHIWGAVMSL